MAIKSLLLHAYYNPTFTSCCLKRRSLSQNSESNNFSKRRGIVTTMVSIASSMALSFDGKFASALDMRMVAPEQTVEEAESGVRGHAHGLLEVKGLIDSESWSDAQKFLRKSSSYLKRDLYTIIQGRPSSERPQLRKLYFDLFSNVTKVSAFAFSLSIFLYGLK